ARALRPVEDESAIVRFEWKPNLPVLGRKYGSGVADIRKGLAGLDLPTPSDAEPRLREALERREAPAARSAVAEAVRSGRSREVAGYTLEREDILLEPVDAEGYARATEAGYTVAVTTEITPELADEGLAREIVRRLQDLRREAGFDLSD